MAYLDTIKAGAVSTWQTHQVLPSVVGAQAALESGWGTSKLAKPPYNNQFGIKASADWTGRTVNMPTREYISGAWITVNADFRAYDSAGDSVRDHGAFFTSTPWREDNYKDVVGETDYKKACWALQNAPAPYATDTGYAQKLINLIENNNLQSWDIEALADNSNTVATQAQQTIVSKMVGADLTDAGKQYVRDLDVTMIGDSLGVGTKPYFESLVPKANYDVLGSRQITHATNSLNGTYVLQQMKNAGTLKEYVVVILGTNRGVTEQEVNNFASIAGDNHKVIFVDTASEVAHINTLSVYYQDAAKRLNNVYFANWRLKANALKPQYYSKDGANGEYIHMTPLGYQKHAEFIAQALYEVATANFTDRVAEATKAEFYNIENFELNEDGLITYDAWRVNADGTSTKYKATKQTDIKGLYSPYGESNIYNPSANQQYGLGNSVNNSNWRETYFEDSEETDGLKLIEKASAELIERQEPEMIYTVNLLEIPVELSIGDTGIFVDHEFNPPLYIRARVLSITTSETNANLNKVTIGNVTELQPQDKSALMAIRAELQETRKDLESSWIGSMSIDMTIVSTNGYVLGDRTRETSLVAKVFKGKDDITDQYEVFTWERISEDTAKDTVFNNALSETIQSSVLTVHEKDVIGNQSKFVARAFNATGELISHQEIVIKRVETALWTDTDTAPPYATDGATWTKPDGSQWVLVDGVWEEKVNQEVISQVRVEVEDAMAEAEQAKEAAEQAYTDAVAEAKRSADEADALIRSEIEQEISAVETEMSTAKQEAIDASNKALEDAKAHADAEVQASKEHFDSLIEDVESGVADAQATADSAVEQIDTAVAKAGFTSLDDTIQNISSIASGAQTQIDTAIQNAGFTSLDDTIQNMNHITMNADQNAQQAITDASSAYGLAQTSISEAQTAQANSLDALSKADDALGGVSDLDFRVDEVEAELELKANNTFMNEDGTLTTLSNAITFNANRFSTDMSRIESRVNSLAGTQNVLLNSHFKEEEKNWRVQTGTPIYDGETVVLNGLTEIYQESVGIDSGTDTMFETRVKGTGMLVVRFGGGGERVEVNVNETEFKDLHFVIEVSGNKNIIISSTSGNLEIDWVKLSTSQIETGWTPAFSDTLTTAEITIFRNQYDDFADKTERRLTAIDSTGGRLEIAEALITQTANGLQTTIGKVDSQGSRLSTVEQTATGLQSSVYNEDGSSKITQLATAVNSVVSDFVEAEKGSENLLPKTNFEDGLLASLGSSNIDLAIVDVENPNGQTAKALRMNTLNDSHYLRFQDVTLDMDETYTFSMWVKRVSGGYYSGSSIGIGTDWDTEYFGVTGDNWMKVEVTGKPGKNFNFIQIRTGNQYVDLYIYRPKLEIGEKATRWSPGLKDIASQSQISQLSESITQSVSDLDGRVSEQKQTIDSISSTVSGHGGRISAVEQTASGLQSTVADKANQTQVTQLANGFNVLSSEFEDYQDGLLNTLTHNVSDWELGGFSFTTGVEAPSNTRFRTKGFIPISDIDYISLDSTGYGEFVLFFYDKNKSFLDKTKLSWDNVRLGTYEVPLGTRYFRATSRYANDRSFSSIEDARIGTTIKAMVVKGAEIVSIDKFKEPNPLVQGQLSVLNDNINLRVSKGDVLSQINLEAERTLIQSNRLVLDANSVVFTGNAFIPSAQIQSIHADKINTGTIDTARLDATEIVAEGLTTNVVEANHILANNALIDNIFATQVLVDRLWAKEIWANKITTMELDAGQIKAGTIDTARLNASDIVTKGLTTNVVTADHILANNALIDNIFATQVLVDRLWNKEMWTEKINAIEIDVDRITGNTANFVSAGFQSLNSQATINGHAIRIQNTAGEFVEMNNTPELRSDDAGGTAVVLGKGRVHFYDSRGHSKGYVGTDMHTAGSYDFGTFLSKGSGIYRFARMADATQTTYAYYTVKAGITTASPIITDMVRTGLLPDGNAQQFVAKGNMISQLNGWPNYPNWPTLSAGQQIRYKELTAQTTGDAYEDIWKFGPSSAGDWRIYFAKHATFEGGTTGASDRRIKHDIAPTQIEALNHIESLTFKEFKWNRNNSFEPLGLIAQDSGILRVQGGEDEMEGFDIQRALMLALKGIQELQEEVKQLKGV